jgi:AraC-like DNA-binding protein
MKDEKTILVKNMVCHRCVMAVEEILIKNNIAASGVIVGEIHLNKSLSDKEHDKLKKDLSEIGLELIDNNRTSQIIEKLKSILIKIARDEKSDELKKSKLSNYLSTKLNLEYTYLSSLFSSIEGRTIESFFIEQRIEYAKELLVYDQLTLSEIAYKLGYSSVAHLSSQFKKTTGLTPSHFREIGNAKRKALDKI